MKRAHLKSLTVALFLFASLWYNKEIWIGSHFMKVHPAPRTAYGEYVKKILQHNVPMDIPSLKNTFKINLQHRKK